jgi:hypothetical protein
MKDKISSANILIWIIFIIIIFVIIWVQYGKKSDRSTFASYTTGTVLGTSKVGRGEEYVKYTYEVNSITYEGSMPVKFCLECPENCCKPGGTVKVRYDSNEPSNSDLIH